jgi:hypothetical protein
MRPRYAVGRKMSDKNPEEIKFCERIGDRASETSALLTTARGKYAMKKYKWKCGQNANLGALRSKIRCYLEKTQTPA